jgi:hypothetical protein
MTGVLHPKATNAELASAIAASAWLDIAKASSLTEPPCVLNTCVQNPRTCCFPLAAELSQLGKGFVLVEIDHPSRPAVRDRQVVEAVEDSGEALGGKALDRNAANELVAEHRRITRNRSRPPGTASR